VKLNKRLTCPLLIASNRKDPHQDSHRDWHELIAVSRQGDPWIITAVLLVYALFMHLIPALFAGLLIYHLTHLLAIPIRVKNISHRAAKIIAVIFIALIVVTAIAAAIGGITSFLHTQQGGISPLLVKIADILEHSRTDLPTWVTENFPRDALELQKQASVWLREHAGEVPILGKEAGHIVAMVLIGMILGVMAAMQEAVAEPRHTPFVTSLLVRLKLFSAAFGNVVGARRRLRS
jgi:predicted PurR-regulated permease PerM